MTTFRLIPGDCLAGLATLPDASVHCCVTSPPYWGLRDYGVDGQLGLEPTPGEYVAKMVAVFREVKRVLRDDGTLWLNLGDSFFSTTKGSGGPDSSSTLVGTKAEHNGQRMESRMLSAGDTGVKPKDLVGIPWRVAFALQADGWYLRSDIVWAKPNPMPESVTDRPTKAHEYVFLLSKSARYWYDAGAIQGPSNGSWNSAVGFGGDTKKSAGDPRLRTQGAGTFHADEEKSGRNARSVWTIATQPFSGAHFATMPPALAERCIKAGCPEGGTVLDPFGGAGTTGLVADRLGRNAILIELNPVYAGMARKRIANDAPLITEVA